MKQFIFGGARSGKSRLAEQLSAQQGEHIVYIATADRRFNDAEMDQRIVHHQQQRPSHWLTVETPLNLAASIAQHADSDCIMIDCLTLWLSNCLHQESLQAGFWAEQRQALLDSLEHYNGHIVIVSNEVGMGIVPMGELSRRYVDESGFLHQAVAKHCDRVVFTAAGLPLVMKGPALTEY